MTTAQNGMLLHPAALLLAWLALLVLASASWQGGLDLPPQAELLTAISVISLGFLGAGKRFITLLRRARWLLLSVALLGIWTTPGLAISWLPGATYEGFGVTSDQLVQLLMTFAMVALLLQHLSIESLLLGLHTLTIPLRTVGFPQDRCVLRLTLTLAELETNSANPGIAAQRFSAMEQSIVVLPVRRFSGADFSLLGLVGTVLFAGFAYA